MGVALLIFFLVVACAPQPTPTSPPPPTATPVPSPTPRSLPTLKQFDGPPPMTIDTAKTYSAILHTNMGDIVIELLADEAPVTVNNLVFLAREGFYDGVPFHRVLQGFMVQTGDPTGTGAGGPGYRFADEPVSRDYVRGTVAMANAGPDTNGSQFFIMHGERSLPKNYTIFGIVQQGMDVVDAIATTPVTTSSRGEPSVPTVELYVETVEITEQDAGEGGADAGSQ